jgi:hypothetical protein
MARSTKAMTEWNTEDLFWRDEFRNRPYAADRDYLFWQPAYRYGFDAAERYPGKHWDDIEDDLETGWATYEGRDERSTWAQVKDAVRDAWHRVTARV